MAQYSFLAKFFHHLILNYDFVSEFLFDIEVMSFGRNLSNYHDANHVFICGLARSGTTILMRALYETNEFCSLTYRDMPLVLSPNLWAKISKCVSQDMIAEQRAHGDGILVDFDSPEALDEIFWRVHCSNEYIGKNMLRSMNVNQEAINKFRQYIALVLKRYEAERYLSKNNNNVLRFGVIQEAFPLAKILIPFRDPIQQAISLMRQHEHFLSVQKKDTFALKYMQWLAHYEFGSDHRPFVWGEEVGGGISSDKPNYWLAQWVGVYGYIIGQTELMESNGFPICYELLCTQTDAVWSGISEIVGLKEGAVIPVDIEFRSTTEHSYLDQNLVETATSIYAALKDISQRRILR